MSFQWTGGDCRFQADVDDMLQEFTVDDVAGLSDAVAEGRISFSDPAYADRVAHELRARAEEGLLFRPLTSCAPTAPNRFADDVIPW